VNGTNDLMVCVYDVNVLGENINTMKNTEALLQPSREVYVEVNTVSSYVLLPKCRMKSQFNDS